MKKIIIFLCSFIFLFLPVKAIEFDINSSNALLYNLNEDKILYEKSTQEKVAIASLTKIMTGIVAVENINNLEEKVTLVSSDFTSLVEENASVAGFKVGEVLTYRDLLYGLLLPSGADAAQALTRLIAGGRENFVKLMNEKALSLGMNDTHFVNETGLDNENHYSTVADVAKMFKYALANETLKEIMTTTTYKTSNKEHTLRSTISNFKVAYNLDMDYLLGGKTGTTSKAGRCLASLASFNGTDYILITVGAEVNNKPLTMEDARIIYSYFMNNYSKQKILTKNDKILTLKTEYAKEKTIDFYAPQDITKYVANDFKKENLTINYEGSNPISYKIAKGEKLGTITISYDNEILLTEDIILENDLTFDVVAYLQANPSFLIIGLSVFLFLVICLLTKLFKSPKSSR